MGRLVLLQWKPLRLVLWGLSVPQPLKQHLSVQLGQSGLPSQCCLSDPLGLLDQSIQPFLLVLLDLLVRSILLHHSLPLVLSVRSDQPTPMFPSVLSVQSDRQRQRFRSPQSDRSDQSDRQWNRYQSNWLRPKPKDCLYQALYKRHRPRRYSSMDSPAMTLLWQPCLCK